MMFGEAVDKEIMRIAKSSKDEVCGIIQDGKVVEMPNLSNSPSDSFLLNSIPDDAQAVFHSHPGGPFYPSKVDFRQQYAIQKPWAIACFSDRHSDVIWFGDGTEKKPLIGRPFIHGVSDCYSLVEDFYQRIHGISLPHESREWEWWAKGDNLYENGFESAGFYEIGAEDVLPGDSFLAQIGSKVVNHAGVFLGNGLILHHVGSAHGYDPTRLSVVEPAARWVRFITKYLRHENSTIDRTTGQGIWPIV